MIPIFLASAIWLPAILGFGATLLIAWPKASVARDPSALLLVAISGFAILGTIATTINFFSPIGPPVAAALFICGWLLFIVYRSAIWGTIFSTWPGSPRGLMVLVGILLLWSAYVSRMLPLPYDTGLYHLQAIKWITHSQLPPGLANLHSRFGFNSAWFSAAAALEVPFLEGKSIFIIDGLMYAIFGVAMFMTAANLVAGEVTISSLFLALSGFAWLWHARWEFLGSPSPEVPVTVLGIVTVYSASRALCDSKDREYNLFVAFAVAVYNVTVKPSAVPLLLAPLLAAMWVVWKGGGWPAIWKSNFRRLMIASCLVLVVLVVPWLARGIVLSGYLAYPSTWGRLGVLSWALPSDVAAGDTAWIMSWARQPGLSPDKVLANWGWFPGWFARFTSDAMIRFAAGITLIGLLMCLAAGTRNLVAEGIWAYLVPLATSIVGTAFWFLSAPDVRFGLASIWSLALSVLVSGIWRLHQAYHLLEARSARVALLGVGVGLLAVYSVAVSPNDEPDALNVGDLDSHQLMEWPAVPRVAVKEMTTREGVKVLAPAKGDQCWDAALPCTPYFSSALVVQTDESGNVTGFRTRP